jgi:putative hemolysin
MDTDPSSIILQFLLILILILMNAFFAASEIAVVSVNKSKLSIMAGEGNKKAIMLLKLLEEPSKFLATIQVGITLGGFFASASAATSISKPFAELLQRLRIPASGNVALISITIILSYLTLVLGELFPKRLALQNAEGVAMYAVKPILFISTLTSPFVKTLTISTNFLVKLFGINSSDINERVSKEELRMMINVGEENGVINKIESEMINGIFEFDDTLAREIMTPKVNVFALDIKTPIDEIIDRVLVEQYSRIPVYEGDIDNIIGILYMKDLFTAMRKGPINEACIRALLRPHYMVPEIKNIDTLFKELQCTKNHMALLIDEYGGFSGIVTIEDLIEEVMGNIFDEHDENEELIKKIDSNTYLVDGLVDIDEINEALNIHIPTDIYETIGGFVMYVLGSIPDEKEENTAYYDNVIFKVEVIEDKRIAKVRIILNSTEESFVELTKRPPIELEVSKGTEISRSL